MLPQEAYRLLVAFLQCERSFCNLVVPTFYSFGWISLGVVSDALPKGGRKRCELAVTNYTESRQELARSAVRSATQKRQSPDNRDRYPTHTHDGSLWRVQT